MGGSVPGVVSAPYRQRPLTVAPALSLQVCSDPLQPVLQGEAASVRLGDAKVTSSPCPPICLAKPLWPGSALGPSPMDKGTDGGSQRENRAAATSPVAGA